jgi:hypothetical protein
MKNIPRVLLITEVFVGFAFVCFLWLVSFPFNYFWIVRSISNESTEDLPFLFISIFSALGFWAMYNLVVIVLYPKVKPSPRNLIILGLLTGYLGVGLLLRSINLLDARAFFIVLPIFVSFHFLYLARTYFLKK